MCSLNEKNIYLIIILQFQYFSPLYDKWTQILTENDVFHISKQFQGHLNYLHLIQHSCQVVCTSNHQSCQELETNDLLIAISRSFFSKKLLDLCEMSSVNCSVNCNHRFYVQLWQLFNKKRYNFRSKRDRKKKKISCRHEILLRIQCCHKKYQLFLQNIFKQFFFNTEFYKHKVYFQILEVLPVILTFYLPV